MKTIRRAVIDIGTNSVKLLVADVSHSGVKPIIEDSEQTRLGAGFFGTNRLQPESIMHTASAAAQFASQARKLEATSLRIIATSAARDAVNPRDLTSAIEIATGQKVEIISGEQEADLAFQGVTSDPELTRQPLLLVDVGGGSTEFILGQGQQKQFRQSFQLGTVRLLEQTPTSDPPKAHELAACRESVRQFFDTQVMPALSPYLQQTRTANAAPTLQLIGTGGTATILARMAAKLDKYDRDIIESTRLTSAQIQVLVERLWSLPVAERKLIVGLPKNRADVILSGLVIYEQLMAAFHFAELRVTTRGLRFGALMDAAQTF